MWLVAARRTLWAKQRLAFAGCSRVNVSASLDEAQALRLAAAGCRSYAAAAAAAAGLVEPAPDIWRINVVTGNVRGAGTHLPAYVQLIGANGASEKVLVGADDGLPRGSSTVVEAAAPKGLGELRRCYVERARGGYSGTGDGWFLEMVEAAGPHGEVVRFPCHAWFGHSDCGDYVGALERNLIPVKPGDEPSGGGGIRGGSSSSSSGGSGGASAALAGAPVRVTAGGVAFPHPAKVTQGHGRGVSRQHYGWAGEDAYFCCTSRGASPVFGMGVADGVYAWREQGIDSGAFSRALMEASQHMVQAGCEDVLKVLQVADRHARSEGLLGSSTICLVTVNLAAGRMQAATLGDSGVFVVGRPDGGGRLGVKFRTPQQEHEFGRPYQLGHMPHANAPEDADLRTMLVRPGDVIVAGSDGLLDNLSEHEVVDDVERGLRAGARAPELARRIAKRAFEASVDRRRVTPYSRAATEAFDMVYTGGKKDDICVVVALVESAA